MEDNVWKMREIVRKMGMLQRRTDQIITYLNQKIDDEQVSDDLFRALASPVEELEWRISNIENNIKDEEE